MRKFHSEIVQLRHNEVFVFGSNLDGFHGAGAAGFALRGDSRNNWRTDNVFLQMVRAKRLGASRNDPQLQGKWAIFGVGEGFQQGKEGCSYAIPTVTRPGARRSIPLDKIFGSFMKLSAFAAEHPEMTFYLCIKGGGYNGYSHEEIFGVYSRWLKTNPPENISIPFNMQ